MPQRRSLGRKVRMAFLTYYIVAHLLIVWHRMSIAQYAVAYPRCMNSSRVVQISARIHADV
eukprot:6060201-Pleurochrysis_carterae.AAC.1